MHACGCQWHWRLSTMALSSHRMHDEWTHASPLLMTHQLPIPVHIALGPQEDRNPGLVCCCPASLVLPILSTVHRFESRLQEDPKQEDFDKPWRSLTSSGSGRRSGTVCQFLSVKSMPSGRVVIFNVWKRFYGVNYFLHCKLTKSQLVSSLNMLIALRISSTNSPDSNAAHLNCAFASCIFVSEASNCEYISSLFNFRLLIIWKFAYLRNLLHCIAA